jgi:hypothetical protein
MSFRLYRIFQDYQMPFRCQNYPFNAATTAFLLCENAGSFVALVLFHGRAEKGRVKRCAPPEVVTLRWDNVDLAQGKLHVGL